MVIDSFWKIVPIGIIHFGPFPWWEIGATAATVTPTAVLLGIIGCNEFGFF